MADTRHGAVGARTTFTRLFPSGRSRFNDADLVDIATRMDTRDGLKDGPDAEENLFVPAGYTYLGQFVDHDLTFDTTSSLNPRDPTPPSNLRTPSFDLDCVYGSGPADQPYLYLEDGVTFRLGRTEGASEDDDLPRVMEIRDGDKIIGEGRAIIGDKRNDENSIVAQIQLVFLKFHNGVARHLASQQSTERTLFERARDEVRWTYQRMLVEDYLPRIVEASVRQGFEDEWRILGDGAYRLYPPEKRDSMPLEFAAAAYRFGHSMVRTGYRLNRQTALRVFTPKGESRDSLTGFQRLPNTHVIDDWGRFFPVSDRSELRPGSAPQHNRGSTSDEVTEPNIGRPDVRLQFAYKIDPNLVAPLGDLPETISRFAGGPVTPLRNYKGAALSLLNLRRGNKFNLISGQGAAWRLGITPLTHDELVLREKVTYQGEECATFNPMSNFLSRTPLWLYILAEAQRKIVASWANPQGNKTEPVDDAFFLIGEGARTQLGPVGGRIVMETFYGVLDSDDSSFLNAAPPDWQPLIMQGKTGPVTFSRILEWLGLPLTDGFGV